MTPEAMRVSTEAAAAPLPPAREIPSTFVSSIKSWWAAGEKESAASEERLLRKLPFFQSNTWARTNDGQPVVGTSSRVTLDTPKRYINTFSITPTANNPAASTEKDKSPVVLLHGYGAGLGFFFRNFGALGNIVARNGVPLHALDWLGMGRSARIPFRIRVRKSDYKARVSEAESFFTDSLEEWRQRMGVEKMTLVGHSLGAYLSIAYALRYPDRVSKIVLLSPAGMLGDPEEGTSDPSRELTDSQENLSEGQPDKTPRLATQQTVQDVQDEQKAEKQRQPTTRRILQYLWEEGVSPFGLVRGLTVFGPLLVGKYAARRFSGLTEEETRDMNDYILNITLAKGSGEYCISHILAPFAHARWPMVDRISALKIPVVFVYGQHDWMDPEGGAQSMERLKEAGNNNTSMYIIQNAGHHVYLDNPESVNRLLARELSIS